MVYAVVESTEAVGLWHEKRWAEYLTVVATAGFLPFEILELLDRVTVLRVGALVVNLAVLVYLVWAKHLFGLRGGHGHAEPGRGLGGDSGPLDPARSVAARLRRLSPAGGRGLVTHPIRGCTANSQDPGPPWGT